jgi:hypothetical protein
MPNCVVANRNSTVLYVCGTIVSLAGTGFVIGVSIFSRCATEADHTLPVLQAGQARTPTSSAKVILPLTPYKLTDVQAHPCCCNNTPHRFYRARVHWGVCIGKRGKLLSFMPRPRTHPYISSFVSVSITQSCSSSSLTKCCSLRYHPVPCLHVRSSRQEAELG